METTEKQAPKKKKRKPSPKVLANIHAIRHLGYKAKKENKERNAELLGKFMSVYIPRITYDKVDLYTDGGKISRWKIIDEALDYFAEKQRTQIKN